MRGLEVLREKRFRRRNIFYNYKHHSHLLNSNRPKVDPPQHPELICAQHPCRNKRNPVVEGFSYQLLRRLPPLPIENKTEKRWPSIAPGSPAAHLQARLAKTITQDSSTSRVGMGIAWSNFSRCSIEIVSGRNSRKTRRRLQTSRQVDRFFSQAPRLRRFRKFALFVRKSIVPALL